MFPHVFNTQATWKHCGRWMRSRYVHRVDAESTGSVNQTRARNGYLSEAIDSMWGDKWLHQRSGFIIINEASMMIHGIIGRSRSIMISTHNLKTRGLISTVDGDLTTATNRGSWSWLTIAARSWPDHRAIRTTIASSWWATIVGSWPSKPSPDRIKRPKFFEQKIPLKMMYSLLFFLTLDWIVKELSDLKERSWFLRDPPTFRLNFDQNQSGIDYEFHRISSDFPLERRTSTRKKSSQIRFNSSELKPHSCGNQVSSEIQSIIRW